MIKTKYIIRQDSRKYDGFCYLSREGGGKRFYSWFNSIKDAEHFSKNEALDYCNKLSYNNPTVIKITLKDGEIIKQEKITE